jgi:SM-20-related protein
VDESFFDLYVVRNFLDKEACRKLIAEMRQSSTMPALTYGKGDAAVDERVRRVRRVAVSQDSVTCVTQRLEQERAAIVRYFDRNLLNFEDPQFLCYRVGDFFVAHQDGNTGLVNLDTDRTRRISVSIFLNNHSAMLEPDTYAGGALVFSDWRTGSRHEIAGEAGMLVAFRSELTHEVTQVTHGERFAVVSWFGTDDSQH